jgi:hypothetical protein
LTKIKATKAKGGKKDKSKACAKVSKGLKRKAKKASTTKKVVRTLRAKAISKKTSCARYSTLQPNGTSRPHVLKNPE